LLLGVDDDARTEREVFFVKGSDHDAYVHIRSIVQTAKANLLIIDPYMDGSIYQLLGTLTPPTMSVRILTSKCPADFTTKDFHDRFILLDEKRCYLLGASMKDAGNKGFTIVPLQEASIVRFILEHANQVWTAATPL
jgi:hypothetical protein